MSWFKKIISRVLGDEIEETSAKNNANNYNNSEEQYKSFDQIENEYEVETQYIENNYKYEQQYENQRQSSQQVPSSEPQFIRRRDSFKFPVIPDEHNAGDFSTKSTETSNKQSQNRNVELPDWMQQEQSIRPMQQEQSTKVQYEQPRQPTYKRPEQYSPFAREPRGLRGIVEKKSRENYNPFNPSGIKNPNSQRKNNVSSPLVTKNQDVDEVVKQSYIPKKKKFVPTEVPSPIYGFQKRPKKERNIQELLDEKNKEQKNQQEIALQEVAATSLLEEKNKETSTIPTSMQYATPATDRDEPKVEEDHTKNGQDIKITTAPNKEFKLDKLDQAEENIGQVQHVEIQHIVEETPEKYLPSQNTIEESVIEEEPVDTSAFSSTFVESELEEKIVMTNSSSQSIETEEKNGIVDEVSKTTSENETIEETQTLTQESFVQQHHDLQKEEVFEDDETISGTEKETTSTEIEIQEEKTKVGSRIPFNVVMLKSDKEKLAKSILPLPSTQSWGSANTNSISNAKAFKGESAVKHDSDIEEQDKRENEMLIPESTVTQTNMTLIQGEQEEQKETVQKQDTLELQSNIIEEEPPVLNEHLEEALSYLEAPEEQTEDFEWMDAQGEKLIEALSYFQIEGEIVQIVQGPAVTQFEITVGHGVKVSKIRNLADDLKLALAAKDIRIQAPIPGKSSIGIEIPNRTSRPVRLSEVVTHESFVQSKSPLEAALGLDLTGEPVTIDLRKMPHGMIAGATGSGKSVCINSLLISLLLKASPQDVKLMLIDPKMVELAPFNHIPHLVSPVITDVKAATAALKWAVEEMDRRYQLFAHVGARDITRYNKMVEKERKFSLKMPYLVIVIDELADLMMMSPQEVEESICRIAQKARACGIHLVLATQRPSVDVITGLIKSNIPTRIAFSVSSHVDSRTILDSQGAERLLGRGDMLYLGNGMSAPVRVQGTYVTDEEIEAVTNFVRTLGEPDYIFEQEELLKKVESIDDQDELFEEACRFICSEGTVSASSLQRKYRIGYNRAARLVDMMEAQGFISESKGTKPRDVFLTEHDIDEIFGSNHA